MINWNIKKTHRNQKYDYTSVGTKIYVTEATF